MAKTKKMGFGGFLGGALSKALSGGGAKVVKKALAGGIGAAKPSMGAAGVLAKNAVKSPAKALAGGAQKQFMSDKLRGKPLAPGLGPRGATVGGGRPGPRDPGTGSMPRPGGPKPGGMGPRPSIGALGAAGAMAGRALGMGKKKGGAVKKAVKK
jgi:hypothetical protein